MTSKKFDFLPNFTTKVKSSGRKKLDSVFQQELLQVSYGANVHEKNHPFYNMNQHIKKGKYQHCQVNLPFSFIYEVLYMLASNEQMFS